MTDWLHPDAVLRHKIKTSAPPTCRACRHYTPKNSNHPENCNTTWRFYTHAHVPGFPSCRAFNDKPGDA